MLPEKTEAAFLYRLPKAFAIVFVLLLAVAALYMRIHGAGYYHYSPDDMMEIDVAAQKTLPELLHTAMHETAHPPLGYIVRHYWMKISTDAWFMRSEALVFGLLLIALYYTICAALGGPLAGWFGAILATCSDGLIVQSYVVRNYTLFVFLLSLGFYYFIRWHAGRNAKSLIGYAVFGCLACLTHFSAMFAFFCITLCECVWLHQTSASKQKQMVWLLSNAIIGFIALSVYHLWQPLVEGLGPSFEATHTERMEGMLIYPLAVLGYILPGLSVAIGCIALVLLLPFLRVAKADGNPLRFYIYLAAIALLLGTVLFGSGIYPFLGTRRGLWLTPFILPIAACLLSELCLRLQQRVRLRSHFFIPPALIIFCAVMVACYSPSARFSDITEYTLPETQFRALKNTLEALPKPSLIVAEKDDSVLLQNPYPFIHTDSYPQADGKQGAEVAMLIPSADGAILINPIYHRIFSGDMLIAMLEYARDHGQLGQVNTVVFLHTPWSVFPIEELMGCKGLEKKIVTFPASGHMPTRHELKHIHMVVIIPGRVLFDDILSPDGAGRACLSAKKQ